MRRRVRALMGVVRDHVGRGERQRFLDSIRPSDVFLVTYPKSGTTWLGFLIANVLKSDAQEQLNLRNFVKYIPDVNGVYFGNGSLTHFELLPDPRFFFVHCSYDPSFAKVVYVLRDPRDVMVSSWHHKRLTNPEFDLSINEFVISDDPWPWRWDEHVAGWLLDHKHPCLLVVRYEEMHHDAAGVLKRVLEFAGVSYTSPEIERAVGESQFDKMCLVETKFGWEGYVPERGAFVRRGQVGAWKDELDEEALRVLEDRYAKVMRKVGYEPKTQ